MNYKEVCECLCYYDKRNPNCCSELEDKPDDCHCANCFYGRDKLARELLTLIRPKKKSKKKYSIYLWQP